MVPFPYQRIRRTSLLGIKIRAWASCASRCQIRRDVDSLLVWRTTACFARQ